MSSQSSSKAQILNCGECHSEIAADDNFCQECGAAQQSKSRWVTIQSNPQPAATVEAVHANSAVETKQSDLTAGDFLKSQAEQLKISQLSDTSKPEVNQPKLDLPKRDTIQITNGQIANGQEAPGKAVFVSNLKDEKAIGDQNEAAYRSSHLLRSPLLQALEEKEEAPVELSKNFRIAAVAIIVVLFVAACSLFILANFKSINSALTKPQQFSNQPSEKPIAKLSQSSNVESKAADEPDKADDFLSQVGDTADAKAESSNPTQAVPQVAPKQAEAPKKIVETPSFVPAKKAAQTAAAAPEPLAEKPVVAKKKNSERKFVASPLMTADTPPHLVSSTEGAARPAAPKSEFNDKDKDVADYNKMLANFFSNPDNLASKEPPTFSDWVRGGKQEF